MRDSCYLVITKRGIKSATAYKNPPSLSAGEVSVKINISLPNLLFDMPSVEGSLIVSEDQVQERINAIQAIQEIEFELKEIESRE